MKFINIKYQSFLITFIAIPLLMVTSCATVSTESVPPNPIDSFLCEIQSQGTFDRAIGEGITNTTQANITIKLAANKLVNSGSNMSGKYRLDDEKSTLKIEVIDSTNEIVTGKIRWFFVRNGPNYDSLAFNSKSSEGTLGGLPISGKVGLANLYIRDTNTNTISSTDIPINEIIWNSFEERKIVVMSQPAGSGRIAEIDLNIMSVTCN